MGQSRWETQAQSQARRLRPPRAQSHSVEGQCLLQQQVSCFIRQRNHSGCGSLTRHLHVFVPRKSKPALSTGGTQVASTGTGPRPPEPQSRALPSRQLLSMSQGTAVTWKTWHKVQGSSFPPRGPKKTRDPTEGLVIPAGIKRHRSRLQGKVWSPQESSLELLLSGNRDPARFSHLMQTSPAHRFL